MPSKKEMTYQGHKFNLTIYGNADGHRDNRTIIDLGDLQGRIREAMGGFEWSFADQINKGTFLCYAPEIAMQNVCDTLIGVLAGEDGDGRPLDPYAPWAMGLRDLRECFDSIH